MGFLIDFFFFFDHTTMVARKIPATAAWSFLSPSFSSCQQAHPHYNHGCGLEAAHGGFGFSGEDFLSRFGQLKCHQAAADQGGEGQEDGDDLGDADEGGEDEAGDDGGELTDAVEDAKRCPSARLGREFNVSFSHGILSNETTSSCYCS